MDAGTLHGPVIEGPASRLESLAAQTDAREREVARLIETLAGRLDDLLASVETVTELLCAPSESVGQRR